MNVTFDRELLWLIAGVLTILVVATIAGALAERRAASEERRAAVEDINVRIRAWWGLCAAFILALVARGVGTVILFGLMSFLALREFITLTPTRRADHRTLFWAFFIVTPVQYILVWLHRFEFFSVFIPVFAFLLLPARSALRKDAERFLERTATIQWGLMVCVFCLSLTPALLALNIPGYEGQNAKLLLFLVIVSQGSDVLQFLWNRIAGRHPIATTILKNKTWEGVAGGILTATVIGTLLWWATPFAPWQAAAMALIVAVMGFLGTLTMGAIKRDRKVEEFGTMIAGHGGVLDRIDSICFAAPIFFYLTRYFFT